MELTVIRHAIAEDGRDDDARALTEKGRRRFRRVVKGLARQGVRFEHVLHSPKRRAVETTELVEPLNHGESEVTEWLVKPPGRELLALLKHERVAVVGHEPHLSALVKWLSGAAVELKKGGVAVLRGEPEPGGMRLHVLLSPRVFR